MRVAPLLRRAAGAAGGTGWRTTPELMDKIHHYAQFPATGVSLRQMVQFGANPSDGTLFRASQFIVEELPIRLAHRVKDLEALPNGLNEMPSIKRVRDWYLQSFDELVNIPQPQLDADLKRLLYKPSGREKPRITAGVNGSVTVNGTASNVVSKFAIQPEQGGGGPVSGTPENNAANGIQPSLEDWKAEGYAEEANKTASSRRYFAAVEPNVQWPMEIVNYNREVTSALQRIKSRHDGVVSTVAQGVNEWKQSRPKVEIDYTIQAFLDRFYMSRIGIRMLIGQHVALNMDRGIRSDYVGIICTDTNVKEIAQAAIDNARFICEDWYGLYEAPQVELRASSDINFMYVPGHLSHMIFEIVKNSLRATVETHGVNADSYPAIKVIVAEGQEDITIKISDEGGGIPRRAVPYVWTYMYTTAESAPPLDPDVSRSDFKAPLAGFGYGLPISRLYARYFGGDLKLISMEGYGTDVYLHLNRLSSSSEPLP